MDRVKILVLVASLGLLGLVGCDKKDSSGPAAAGSQAASSSKITPAAREAYKTRCATCHGDLGKGDGPAGAALNPKARSFVDKAWQKSVTDDQIKTIIEKGGPAAGKSPLMPGAPDLAGKPEIDGLIGIIRDFGK